jgi:diaminopimelate epimerase
VTAPFPEVAIVKMSGAGNDFLVVDRDARVRLGDRLVPWIRAVCRRGIGIGADGVILLEPGGEGRVLVEFRNPDGSIAFCGNGTRCAARFAERRGWIRQTGVCATAAGDVPVVVRGATVSLRLPAPVDLGPLRLDTPEGPLDGRRIVAGVEHFVLEAPDIERFPLETIGPCLRTHAAFGPAGTNVDVVSVVSEGRIRIRTWERGVEGETLACGSGAVAAAAAARARGAPEAIVVIPRSGIPLRVELPGPPGAAPHATLEGDARFVFEGTTGSEVSPAGDA